MRIHLLSRNSLLYSTQRLFQAARQAGHEVEIFDYCALNVVFASSRPQLYYQQEALPAPDLVIGRVSPVYTPLGASLLDQYALLGTTTAPTADALLLARNKWRALGALSRAEVASPRTAMLSDLEQLDTIAEQLGGYPLVLKLLQSTHGSGVMLAPDRRTARSILDAFAGLHKGILIQEYIKESQGADVRAIVCGTRVVAAMTRTPASGEFRSNLHRGGTPQQTQLSERESLTVIRAARAVGLDVAGVDFLRSARGPLVMEVNASPGLEGIEGATGVDVARAIISYLTDRVTEARR